ncbi:MAG: helix-turn-helix transcriptional regulator [Alphaproteobacteria bacterium]|nr:helix-turn-helix transcriptional regulator [Alphaproteobacteria bacterium]
MKNNTNSHKISANEINAHIGKKLRLRRVELGLSQQGVAKLMNITFQQVQKYERGSNSLSAPRINQLAQAINVPTAYFFEGLDIAKHREIPVHSLEQLITNDDAYSDRELLELTKAFKNIKSQVIRKRLADLARVIANTNYD